MCGILSLACFLAMVSAAMAQRISVETTSIAARCSAADLAGPDGEVPDGRVSVADVLVALAAFRCQSIEGGAQCPADITGPGRVPDGVVNIVDVLAVMGMFGLSCTPADEGGAAAPARPALRGDTLAPGLAHSLPRSGPDELLTLVKRAGASQWPVPCARSYGGHDWEVVRPREGPPASLVHVVSCAPGSGCELSVPADPAHAYVLGARMLPPSRHADADRRAAQLLTQATFGPTRAEMARLGTFASAEAWLIDQIESQPATLHRAYYRQRANPRLDAVSEVGRPRGACEPNSRWNRIAIRADDVAQNISFSAVALPGGGGVTAMYVGGVLRSEVDLAGMRPFGLGGPVGNQPGPADNCNWCQDGGLILDTTYVICRVDEWPMGVVAIGESCQNQLWPGAVPRTEVYNALMRFEALPYPATDALGEPIEVLELGAADAEQVALPPTLYNEGVLLLARLEVGCPFSLGAQLRAATTVLFDGVYHRYDPRLALLGNALESPAAPSSTALSGQMRSCPLIEMTAPKTWLNERSCVVARGCEPDAYAGDDFELNATTIRQFFLEGNNFVYAIDSLPLQGNEDPCKKEVRWRALGPCAGRATALDADTSTVLAAAIRASADANLIVKDVELPREDRGSCSGAHGAIVDVDGACWQHVHGDQLSVYDFTLWAMDHGGNEAARGFFPIKGVATAERSSVLHFPSWHPVSRWTANAGKSHTAIKEPIGRLGDRISFGGLPRRVRSAGFARAVGVGVSAAAGVAGEEMCGSPGEVANEAALGGRFYFGKERYKQGGAYTQQEMLGNHRAENPGAQKQTVHAAAMLAAPDQLRQRVAWALSQTFVLAEFGSAVLADHAEVWTAYYDIFVRHAFGSYRDALLEVSFNPIMGLYLTYSGSASFAYKGSVPDENYAREVMQLFSIGLWQLDDDGTRQLDAGAAPLPTYTNDDIGELARLWTGFKGRNLRGNLEQKRISALKNLVDPMFVQPEARDAFPKMDLYKGHVGDAFPLCADLPPQHFLRAGARFRFLGRRGVPDLVPGRDIWEYDDPAPVNQPLFAPDPAASALHGALCDADAATGACRFHSSITLDGNLACHGEECNLETLRVIKVRPAGGEGEPFYYEYVRPPCVSLAFFVGAAGGRYVENVNWLASHGSDDGLIERLCADPKAPVAAPGCCTGGRHEHCFEYRCAYVEERVSLRTALQRCNTTVLWSAPDPAPLPAAGQSAWSLYPEAYQEEAAVCPAGSSTANESFCFTAATAALAAGGEPHFHTPGNFITQSKGNFPSGCFVKANGDVVFNSNADGDGNKAAKLVCSDVHEDYASDYGGASKLLCARKRRTCWWSNSADNCDAGYSFGDHQTTNHYWWTEDPCRLQAQVNVDGRVSVVHPGGESVRRVGVNSENWFRVRWREGHFPRAASGCGGGGGACSVVAGESGDTCLCEIDMATSAVFRDADTVPSQAEVEEALRIGAPAPGTFDAGAYALCDTPACRARAPLVRVWTRGGAESPVFDEAAIFAVDVNRTNPSATSPGHTRYLANKRSVVTVANATDAAAFSFRNPPQFMSLADPSQRDALYETEAVLDHLFYHANVAPFVATALIRQLVTSNPSPRYVAAVAAAFKSGAHAGRTFSERYGDLGAATAAALLDREARSLTLAADPTHGQIRAPLLRLVHLMRAMEYAPRDDREVELNPELGQQIGQAVYQSPTVFSFFRPDFAAEGAVEASGLVAPEAQLGVLPNIIGLLDGVSALVFDGLTSCAGGFGAECEKDSVTPSPLGNPLANTGRLGFEPADASSAAAVLDELDLLLTGGRLDAHSRAVIAEEYGAALDRSSCPVDRSAELCGRLTPGDTLQPGERLTNAAGEVLCFTRDGVAQHIGAGGEEVFSTAYLTRGGQAAGPMVYRSSGELRIPGPVHWGVSQSKWTSSQHAASSAAAAFHPFLAGPCQLLDEAALARVRTHGYTSFGGEATTTTCDAVSTCAAAEGAPPRPEGYAAARNRTAARQALRVAQTLVAATAAFAVTNDPATSDAGAPAPEPRAARDGGYKALVVLFMGGGADTFNLLVPHCPGPAPAPGAVTCPERFPRYIGFYGGFLSARGALNRPNRRSPARAANCDGRNGSEWYTRTRGAAALDLAAVRPIAVPAGTQLCDTMGLHPRFAALEELYNSGDASLLANIGALVRPVTRKQVVDKEAALPAGLFAHNLQTQGAKTLHPQSTTGGTGVLGRILRAFAEQAAAGEAPIKGSAYRSVARGSTPARLPHDAGAPADPPPPPPPPRRSITTDRTMFRGSPVEPILLSAAEGMLTYEGPQVMTSPLTLPHRGVITAAC
jgi:uncharacterized protein (DUF1800 family)